MYKWIKLTVYKVSGVGQSTKQHKQKKEWQVARDIVRADGMRGLTRGLGLTIAREVPSFGAYFLGYEFFYKHGTTYFPDWSFTITMVRIR